MAANQEIFVLLVEDRHDDVGVYLFLRQAEAIEYARAVASVRADRPEDVQEEELTDAMRQDGWALYLIYSEEGDSVRVMSRPLDSAAIMRNVKG